MSEPKTWGDVIKQEANGDCRVFSPSRTPSVSPAVESVLGWIAQIGQNKTDTMFGLAPGTSKIVCRWLSLDCPPLSDPIPPESPEPATVTTVVRWEPTEEDMIWIGKEIDRWGQSETDRRERAMVIGEAIYRCQNGLPEADAAPEPPTPPTDRIDALEFRLAALESRFATEQVRNISTAERLRNRMSDKEWEDAIFRDDMRKANFGHRLRDFIIFIVVIVLAAIFAVR